MDEEIRHIDLASGIGGFALSAQLAAGWAGAATGRDVRTVAFCEIDPFCQAVLRKNFPGVPIYDDIKTFDYEGGCDLLTAGYPCTPFSVAGKQKGAADDRHLWPSVLEIVKRKRPAWCLFENVSGHVNLGLDEVLLDLANQDYAARVLHLGAVSKNAPHRRMRVWICAKNVGDAPDDRRNWGAAQAGRKRKTDKSEQPRSGVRGEPGGHRPERDAGVPHHRDAPGARGEGGQRVARHGGLDGIRGAHPRGALAEPAAGPGEPARPRAAGGGVHGRRGRPADLVAAAGRPRGAGEPGDRRRRGPASRRGCVRHRPRGHLRRGGVVRPAARSDGGVDPGRGRVRTRRPGERGGRGASDARAGADPGVLRRPGSIRRRAPGAARRAVGAADHRARLGGGDAGVRARSAGGGAGRPRPARRRPGRRGRPRRVDGRTADAHRRLRRRPPPAARGGATPRPTGRARTGAKRRCAPGPLRCLRPP